MVSSFGIWIGGPPLHSTRGRLRKFPIARERPADAREPRGLRDGADLGSPGTEVAVPAELRRSAESLSELELRILAFEGRAPAHAGMREAAIRDEFGVSAARYYQLLYALLESPGAVQHDPVLVHRLLRLREARRRRRMRTLFTDPQDLTP
jgi:hypothetical protein